MNLRLQIWGSGLERHLIFPTPTLPVSHQTSPWWKGDTMRNSAVFLGPQSVQYQTFGDPVCYFSLIET